MHPRSIKSFFIIFALSIFVQMLAVVGNFSIQYLLDNSKKEIDTIQGIEKDFFKILSFENSSDFPERMINEVNVLYENVLAQLSSKKIRIDDRLIQERKEIFTKISNFELDQKKTHQRIQSLLPNLADSLQYIHSHHIAYLRNIVSSGIQIGLLNNEKNFEKKDNVSAPETHIIETILDIHNRMQAIFNTFAKLQFGLSPAGIKKEFNFRINDFYKAINRFEDYSLDAQDGILIEELLVNGRTFETSFKKFLDIEANLINERKAFQENRDRFLSALKEEKARMDLSHQILTKRMKGLQILSILIGIIMFGLLFRYAWIIITAFRRTVDETRKIQKDIQYNIPVSNNDFNELAFVFDALNSMSETIRMQMEKLEDAKAELEKRVSLRTLELKQLNRKLKKEIQDRIEGEQERLKLEKRLFQAHKMESIGTLAGGIAHDFNNILSGMMGFAQLTEKNMPSDPERAQRSIKLVLQGINRAADLTRRILTFSRSTEQDTQILNLADIVKEVIQLIRSTIPAYIRVEENIVSNAMILGDPSQIHQVIMNLCTNASQAMGQSGGVLSISLEVVLLERAVAGHGSEIPPGEYTHLKISDTGIGIDPANLETIFEPYFTTKKVGVGTGLGLAIAHSIVLEHQGVIAVASVRGEGTQFDVYLPLADSFETQSAGSTEEIEIEHGSEHLMIVDDEEQIRESFKELFEDYGYTVSTYNDGPEALSVFASDPEKFQLIISDMSMPEMSGDKFVQKIFEIRKNIPIILCTGFSERADKAKKILHENCHVFQKPVNTAELSLKIRELLNRNENC